MDSWLNVDENSWSTGLGRLYEGAFIDETGVTGTTFKGFLIHSVAWMEKRRIGFCRYSLASIFCLLHLLDASSCDLPRIRGLFMLRQKCILFELVGEK